MKKQISPLPADSTEVSASSYIYHSRIATEEDYKKEIIRIVSNIYNIHTLAGVYSYMLGKAT